MGKFSRSAVSDNDEMEQDETPETFESPTRRISRAIDTGWGAPQEERREVVKSDKLILTDRGKVVIKIKGPIPPIKYARHYVRSAGPRGKYFTCTREKDCPLCVEGVKATATFMLNVVDMSADPTKVVTWTFGPEVSSALQSLMTNPKEEKWPLDAEDHYFQVYHEKVAGREAPATRVHNVSARYLDDYGIEPLNEVELEELDDQLYGADSIYLDSHSFLETVRVLESDKPQPKGKGKAW